MATKNQSPSRHIYVTPEEWRVWKREAQRLGISVSAYLRKAVAALKESEA